MSNSLWRTGWAFQGVNISFPWKLCLVYIPLTSWPQQSCSIGFTVMLKEWSGYLSPQPWKESYTKSMGFFTPLQRNATYTMLSFCHISQRLLIPLEAGTLKQYDAELHKKEWWIVTGWLFSSLLISLHFIFSHSLIEGPRAMLSTGVGWFTW